MTSIVLELHTELVRWLEAVAAKRAVAIESAALPLLEEEPMRESGATKLDVSIRGERWTARMPMRGLLYSGCQTEWTRLPADN